jgi:hypothetical protein
MIGNTILFALYTQDDKGEQKRSEMEGVVVDSWTDTHTNYDKKVESERKYKIMCNATETYQGFLVIGHDFIIRILKFAK